MNENGMLFLQYCMGTELSILNTWFVHPLHHRVTWHHPNGVTKKVYDYSLSCSWIRQYVTDVRVRNSYFDSDHRLVVTKLKTPANKAARMFKHRRRTYKPNFQLLKSQVMHEKATNAIQRHLTQNNCPESLEDMHAYLVNALKKGRKVIPAQQKNEVQNTMAK